MRVKRNCPKSWFAIYGDRAHSVHETVIHDIDLLLWFLGNRCKKVYVVARHLTGHRFPDATVAILQFAGGAVATVETSWFVPERAPANVLPETWSGTIDAELEIVGTEQTARLRILESGFGDLDLGGDEASGTGSLARGPRGNRRRLAGGRRALRGQRPNRQRIDGGVGCRRGRGAADRLGGEGAGDRLDRFGTTLSGGTMASWHLVQRRTRQLTRSEYGGRPA
jgi:predicted dehydrogenase